MNSHQRWFSRYPGQGSPSLRLFCFPYAGGDGQVYRRWAGQLSPTIEVVGVEYPGRGRRFGEPLITQVSDLVEELLPAIRPLLDRPFAFYGHSNGALVAYELAKQVRAWLFREPEALFLAAKRSPLLPREKPLHRLPDAEFIRVLRDYDGTPQIVLETPQLLEVYLPVLRADFALSENYCLNSPARSALRCHLIAGTHDRIAPPTDIVPWAELFDGPVGQHTVEGGHFFLNSHLPDVARIIDRVCAPAF